MKIHVLAVALTVFAIGYADYASAQESSTPMLQRTVRPATAVEQPRPEPIDPKAGTLEKAPSTSGGKWLDTNCTMKTNFYMTRSGIAFECDLGSDGDAPRLMITSTGGDQPGGLAAITDFLLSIHGRTVIGVRARPAITPVCGDLGSRFMRDRTCYELIAIGGYLRNSWGGSN